MDSLKCVSKLLKCSLSINIYVVVGYVYAYMSIC